MTRTATWYFDYISPYTYLQLARFDELPADVKIEPVPVLFAAMLNHWGHKGPAEIEPKKRQTYLLTRWLAEQRGLPFTGPPRHPFNPLALARLTIALGVTMDVITTTYAHVWAEGNDGEAPESIAALAAKLGVEDWQARIADPAVKAQLRENTERAIARGVYGVPTLAYQDEIFWGDDATPLFAAFLENPRMFKESPYVEIEAVKPASVRPGGA